MYKMYYTDYNDEMVQCPFNKYHIMPSTSLQRHIVKCEKNYPQDYKVICPYNATHRLSKCEIADHINTCPTRNTVEASYFQQTGTHNNSLKPQEECNSTSIDCTKTYEEENMKNIKSLEYQNKSMEEDMESFVSTMGMGRGRIISNHSRPSRKMKF